MSIDSKIQIRDLSIPNTVISDIIDFSKSHKLALGVGVVITSIAIGILFGPTASLNFGIGTFFGYGLQIFVLKNQKIQKDVLSTFSNKKL